MKFQSSLTSLSALLLCMLQSTVVVFGGDVVGTPSCYDDFDLIYQAELQADDSVKRTYVLCPYTEYTPSRINAAQSGFEGMVPLILKSRATVKCGDDGSSKNECIIDGSGTFGVVINPLGFFQDFYARNIVLQGLTFRDFIATGEIQSFISYQAVGGKVLVKDCIFEYSGSQPMFQFIQILINRRQRFRELSDGEEEQEEQRMTEIEVEQEMKIELTEQFGPPGIERFFKMQKHLGVHNRTRDIEKRNGMNRDLQFEFEDAPDDAPYNIFVENCTFLEIILPEIPRAQGALSLMTFVAIKVADPTALPIATINANFKQIVFNGITAAFGVDPQQSHRSIIDFFSSGKILLQDLCFENIEHTANAASALVMLHKDAVLRPNFDPSTIYIDSSTVTYIDGEPKCQLLSIYEPDADEFFYDYVSCGPNATGTSCFNAPAPAPAPPAGGGFDICFSSKNTVQVLINGKDSRSIIHRRHMDQLKLGDRVLVDKDNQKYEPIYSFGHYHTTQTAQFVQLMPSRMELSSQHLIFLRDGRAVPAEIVQVGDILESGQTVTGVRSVTRHTGVYAPFTPSGKIVVNDQVASTFVSLQPKSDVLLVSGRSTGITHQWLAHTFETPHRLWCSYSGACTEENYTIDGVSTWVSSPLKFFLWLLDDDKSIPMLSAVQVCLSAILMIIMASFLKKNSSAIKKKLE